MESFILLGLLFAIGVPALALIAFVRTSTSTRRIEALERNVRRLNREIDELQSATTVPDAAPIAEAPAQTQERQVERETKPPAPRTVPVVRPKAATKTAVPPTRSPAVDHPKESWFPETLGAANWLIIAGGVALALALGFLVKYSVEEGWLGPAARVIIGGLFGIGLLVTGDVARRKPLGRGPAIVKSDAMPATLTGAGIIALFASIYGAYALYDLLSPVTTYTLLVLISGVAVILSFIHGRVIAGLGMSGAYVVPLLVQTADPSAAMLFGYLFVVTVAVVLIGRFRWWSWATAGGLVASSLWSLFYIGDAGLGTDRDVLAIFWFASFCLYTFVPTFSSSRAGQESGAKPPDRLDVPGLVAGVISSLVIFCIFFMEERAFLPSLLLSALIVSNVYVAWKDDAKLANLFIGCGAAVLALVTWELFLIDFDFAFETGDYSLGGPNFPAGTGTLAYAAAAVALLFTGAGILRALLLKSRAGLWSAVGVAMALIALGTVYLRMTGLSHSISWAVAAAGLSVVFVFTAAHLRSRIGDDLENTALAAYAVGVLAALALGAALVFERVWLTIALALMAPAIAWVYTRISLPILRRLAMIFGIVVLLRLLANPFIFDYEIVKPLIFNWLLYGYGVPAAAFFWAARLFRSDSQDRTVQLLEAGALVFGVVCVTTQVRLFIHDGDLRSGTYLLSEASLNTIIWATFAYGLFRQAGPAGSLVVRIGTRVLVALTLGHIGLFHILVLNPYWSGEAVGKWPFLNVLFLAYVVPAAILSAFHLPWHREKLGDVFGEGGAKFGVGMISLYAFVLGLIYISLEVTRAWHGSVLTVGETSDSEIYTYSLVWLLYAGVLMGLGIWRHNHFIRMAAMTVIALVTLKIFVVDMSNLQGLLRVFSFAGLAVSLLGIGFLYQRFVIVEGKGGDDPKGQPEPDSGT